MRILPAIACLLLLTGFGYADEQVIPQGYPVERYEPLWKKSPFSLSSANAVVAAPAGFADSLALTGVMKIGGEVYVSVVDKVTRERQMLSTKAEGQAILVEKLDLADNDPSKVAVTLKKGEEISLLRYDMDFLKQMAAVSAPATPVPVPMQAAPPPVVNANPAAPRIAPPAPTRPPVQRRIIIPAPPPRPPTS
jgi:hypothetical protein